jgi:hypothetical protein
MNLRKWQLLWRTLVSMSRISDSRPLVIGSFLFYFSFFLCAYFFLCLVFEDNIETEWNTAAAVLDMTYMLSTKISYKEEELFTYKYTERDNIGLCLVFIILNKLISVVCTQIFCYFCFISNLHFWYQSAISNLRQSLTHIIAFWSSHIHAVAQCILVLWSLHSLRSFAYFNSVIESHFAICEPQLVKCLHVCPLWIKMNSDIQVTGGCEYGFEG